MKSLFVVAGLACSIVSACSGSALEGEDAAGSTASPDQHAAPEGSGSATGGGAGGAGGANGEAALPASPLSPGELADCIERTGVELSPAPSARALAVMLAVVQARCRPAPAELEQLALALSGTAP